MVEIKEIKSYDGYGIKAKISYPDNKDIDKAVIYVNGSGVNTYDNKRRLNDGRTFNYHDLFEKEFLKRDIAYCRYNTRGVEISDEPPLFSAVNEKEYKTYFPSNSVKDIESIINYILSVDKFKNAKIYLLGWSEGTIIAPLAALNKKAKVDGLLLAGYVNENLKDTMIWQMSGNYEFTFLRYILGYNKKEFITKDDIEAFTDKELLGDLKFEDIDINGDGKIDAQDFAPKSLEHLKNMLLAIENNDDEWLKNNHGVRLTSRWFKEHFKLKPNKEVLPELTVPIYIFHGEMDAMCPKSYAEEIKEIFLQKEKENLTVNIFENHDHDLNFLFYVFKNEISDGLKCIFDTVLKL